MEAASEYRTDQYNIGEICGRLCTLIAGGSTVCYGLSIMGYEPTLDSPNPALYFIGLALGLVGTFVVVRAIHGSAEEPHKAGLANEKIHESGLETKL